MLAMLQGLNLSNSVCGNGSVFVPQSNPFNGHHSVIALQVNGLYDDSVDSFSDFIQHFESAGGVLQVHAVTYCLLFSSLCPIDWDLGMIKLFANWRENNGNSFSIYSLLLPPLHSSTKVRKQIDLIWHKQDKDPFLGEMERN